MHRHQKPSVQLEVQDKQLKVEWLLHCYLGYLQISQSLAQLHPLEWCHLAFESHVPPQSADQNE